MLYEGKVKISSLAYNQRETQDKWSLRRDQDRSWCHCQACVKLFFGRSPWIHGCEWQHTSILISMEPWAAAKRALHCYTGGQMTPAPVRIPTQWPLVPGFVLAVGWVENFLSCLHKVSAVYFCFSYFLSPST